MGGSGIRHTAHIVNVHGSSLLHIPIRNGGTVAIAHDLHIDTLIGGGGITVVTPQKRTDLHLFAWLCKLRHGIRCQLYDLAGAKLFDMLIAQLGISKLLKGNGVTFVISADLHGNATQLVACSDQTAVIRQQ